MKITSRLSGHFGLALVIRLSQRFRWQNEMKLKRAVISVCTWTFSVVLAAAAQSIAAERPPQTSPDTTVLERGIKEKLESANPDARRPSPSKASPSRSYLKLEPVRSFRHGAYNRRLSGSPRPTSCWFRACRRNRSIGSGTRSFWMRLMRICSRADAMSCIAASQKYCATSSPALRQNRSCWPITSRRQA